MPQRPLRWFRLPVLFARTIVADARFYQRVPGRPNHWRGIGTSVDAPVFVVGAPRSGTTFLGAAVGRIPEVSYHFEPAATKAFAPYLASQGAGVWRRRYRFVYASLAAFHRDGGLLFVEKTPRNALILGPLSEAFPRARFVHLIRDGRDVAVSWSEKAWLGEDGRRARYEPGGYRYGPYPRMWTEPERLAAYGSATRVVRAAWGWRRHVELARRHGAGLGTDRYVEVRYEDIARAPEQVASDMASFLGLERNAQEILSSELGSMRASSIGRWRDSLRGPDLEAVMVEIGTTLSELGYR